MPMVNRVKQFAKVKGISIYQFIKDTGISPTTGYALARDPNHLPSIKVLELICDVYEVESNEFVVRVK